MTMEQWVIRPGRSGKACKIANLMLFGKPSPCRCLRVMPILAAAMAGGNLCGIASARVWLCPAAGCLMIWLFHYRLALQPDWLRIAVPALFILSAVRISLILLPAGLLANRLAGQNFQLQGRICSIQSGREDSGQVRVKRPDGIIILLKGDNFSLPFGTGISIAVSGVRPDGQRNPGGFNEKTWLAAQGIYLIARPLADNPPVITSSAPVINLPEWGALMRSYFRNFASSWLGKNEAALLTGLLLGDTGGITIEQQSDFRRSGLTHLTSVSGANVSLVLLPVTLLVRRGRLNRKIRLWLLIGTLVGFGFLTGWQISVTRAVLMAGFVLAGQLMHRRADPLNSLAAAACLLILIQPLTVLATGFWLSLIATASILLLAVPLVDMLQTRMIIMPGFLLTGPIAALCAQFAVLPLISQSSQEISIWGLLANIPAGPLAGYISLVAILYLPIGVMFSLLPGSSAVWLLNSLGQPIKVGLQLLYRLASLFAHQKSGRLTGRLITPAFWLLWLLILLVLIRKIPEFNGWPSWIFRTARRICIPAAIACLLTGFMTWLTCPAVTAWFLDVGQGDAILIQTNRNESILIDGGATGCGYRVLMPALDALGIRQIDLVIATHGHADHIGGLIELVDAGRVCRLMIPAGLFLQSEGRRESDLIDQLAIKSEIFGIGVSELTEDDTIVLGSQIHLDVLEAGPADPGERLPDGNDRSLILLALLAGQRVLLAADCTGETEKRLLSDTAWPEAEILKVAHHGSRLATSDEFLHQVQPKAAIISVGPNVFGHPSADVLSRLKDIGCQTLRTDRLGALQLVIDHNSWQIHTLPGQ